MNLMSRTSFTARSVNLPKLTAKPTTSEFEDVLMEEQSSC